MKVNQNANVKNGIKTTRRQFGKSSLQEQIIGRDVFQVSL
jgi:hypothetical protein